MNRTTKTANPVLILLTMLAGAWVTNLASASIRTDRASGKTWEAAINNVAQAFNHPFTLSFHRTDLIAAGIAAVVIGLIWAYKYTDLHNFRDGEEHGSASWGTPKDMAPYTDKNLQNTLQMTQTESLSLDTHKTHRNLNTLVIGSSGSGKTRGYVLPNLSNNKHLSWAVTDPKGEILRSMKKPLEKQGYNIRTLNLVDLSKSNHFNPLAYIDPTTPEPAILRLVDNLMTNTEGDKQSSGDSFWTKSERALLTALFAWTYYTSENPNLNQAVDLVGKMEASENNENHMSEVDAMMAAAREMIQETQGHENEWDDDVNKMIDGLAFASRQYRTFEQGAGETKKSIIISAGVRLAPLQIRQVRDIITDDTIDLKSVGTTKTALFLILSDTDNTFNFLAAIFYQCLFESLVYKADHSPTGELTIPVHCLLDEFANIGKIPGFDRLIATIRSRNISVSVIIQNIAQLKSMYKDNSETIIGNCDNRLFLGGGEASTTKLMSDALGQETIDVRDTSESKGTNGSYTISYRKTARNLLDQAELAKLPDDTCIYILRGVNPFLSKKIR